MNGYHPFAEDGGIYAAAVTKLLDPALFPRWSEFVQQPMHPSLFAPAIAALVRVGHLSLPEVLLVVHIATMWATLFAAWLIAEQCWPSRQARAGAVLLLSCWLALPVAGTSLEFMDPYVTARSLSTPCMVLALAGILRVTERRGSGSAAASRAAGWIVLAVSLVVAVLMHALMAGYAVGACCLLASLRAHTRPKRIMGAASVCLSAVTLATGIHLGAPPESDLYVRIELTRTYWFPACWKWYELVGLAAPVAIVAAAGWGRTCPRLNLRQPERALARMAALYGSTAVLIAFTFANTASSEHLVARLQPLRVFQIVYLVMVLFLGAHVAEQLLGRKPWRWCAAILLLCAGGFAAERAVYINSNHLELPGLANRNPWVQAFLWVRGHTPKDALFALDPDYIHAPGEDGQCFRAIAQRSALPDFSKDGGEASVAPQLAEQWQSGLRAQQSLGMPIHLYRDSSGASALRAVGVSWVILRAKARTDLICPYSNTAAKVCKIS